jgi:hypothetical protein
MTRTVTGTVVDVDGTPLANSDVTFQLLELFTTATEVYLPGTQTVTTDAQGQFSTTLGTPDSGTAPWQIGLATGHSYLVNLAAGTAVDLVTLILAASPAVDPDAVQTLIDNNNRFTKRTVTGADTVEATDELLLCSGTFALTCLPTAGLGKAYIVKNIGTGAITATAAGSDLIDGAATKIIYPGGAVGFIDVAVGVLIALGA